MPQLEAGMMLAQLLKCERNRLYLDRDFEVSDENVEKYIALINERCMGAPIQYIIKQKEFMGLDFYVDGRVLIPRADTEYIVEHVIEYASKLDSSVVKILDVGTGSGAIAVSLAHYLSKGPKALITAIDIDCGALEVARMNAASHGLESRIRLLEGDLFSPLEENKEYKMFDIMVSNPPYIKTSDINGLQRQVRDFEPRRALDGGEDGLHFYRRLAREALPFLVDGALWVVEVGYDQADKVADILNKMNCYRDIYFIKDLQGYDRGVAAILELEGANVCWKS